MDAGRRIERLALSVSDLGRSISFYETVLGFETEPGSARGEAVLRLGRQSIVLRGGGAAKLGDAALAANDPLFQHFAIVVTDIAAAHAQASPISGPPLSRGGPQQLPPENGGALAWKFRDPDGHPLELLQTRSPAWAAQAQARPQALFLGIDHTALACADLARSLAFYAGLGFTPGDPSYNRGPAQDRLDGLERVDLQIATLYTPEPGPHIELLHYTRPAPPAAPAAEAAEAAPFICTVLAAAGVGARETQDPDGHRLAFEGEAGVKP